MVTKINQEWYISTTCNGIIIDLPFTQKYGQFLSLVKDLSPKTIANYMGSLYRFWVWSIAVEPQIKDDFELYISRYKREMQNGLIIYDYIQNEDTKIEKTEILNLSPKIRSSIDTEISNLMIYFNWMKEKQKNLNLEKDSINWDYERRRKQMGKHSSYISNNMDPYTYERILKKENRISKSKKRKMNIDKAFPFKYFDNLIEISEVREKILYCLMAGTSARIGQALNLTIYDIDYKNREVYLSDPSIDDENQKGYLGMTRKKWLSNKYSINAKDHPPHAGIQFKYPIPSRSNKPLFWINETIKNYFFSYLEEYNIFPEYLRTPRHPFFFTTDKGTRLLYKPVYDTFKRKCNKLDLKYDDIDFHEFGLHSLRHLWGNYMAEIYYLAHLNKLPIEAEKVRLYAQYGMGHSNEKSIDIYFNTRMDTVIESCEEFYIYYLRDQKHLPTTLFLKGLAK